MIRGTVSGIHPGDVYVSRYGDALVWVDEDTIVHVDRDGNTQSVTGEWETGWDA
jgi:hypothetical protein